MSPPSALGHLLNAGLLSAGVLWQATAWGETGAPASAPGASTPLAASQPAAFNALAICEARDQAMGLERPAQALAGGARIPAFRLSGSLCLPENGRAPQPLVVLISGSGATDRDGNSLGTPLRASSLKWVAAELARQGVASLRFDKRFLPASGGSLIREEDLRIEHLAEDVVAWVRQLRADRRFNRIILAGHSEGGMVALLAAREIGVDGVVLLATPGRPLGEVLREQLDSRLPSEWKGDAERILSSLEHGEAAADVPAPLLPLYRSSVQPYLISLLRVKPAELVRQVKVPVMVVQGDTDLQVGLKDFERLASARPDVQRLKVAGMNHMLKQAGGDLSAQSLSYQSPDLPLAPGWLPKVAGFAKGRSGD